MLAFIEEMKGDPHFIDKASFAVRENLHPKFWFTENMLNPKVKEKLIEITDDFVEGLDLDIEVEDITFTGSLSNYTWSKYSDIDLHIIVDFSKLDKDDEFLLDYFNAKKSVWNRRHNIMIYGFEVEIYVQNLNETLDINSASICVVNKATSTATAVEVSPFDEGGYSSDDFDTRYSNDMTHTTSTGVFQPLFEGKYWIFYSGYLTIASDDDVVTKLKHNDTVILEGSAKIDSLDDPHNRSYTTVIDCRRTDTLSVTVDSDGQDIQIQPGTSFTVVRLSDWAIGETTPAESVNARDDYKIDSFGQLSKQHRRHTDQVPFVLATPGPLSLRQRNSAAIITAGTSDES